MPDGAEKPIEQLESVIAEGDRDQLDAYVGDLTTSETARAVSHLEQNDQARLLTLMSSADAADPSGRSPLFKPFPS